MDTDSAYKLLDSMAEKDDIGSGDVKIITQLSGHEDPEIRAYSAQLLVSAKGSSDAEKALIELCSDSDELVRVNACDSLTAFADIGAYNQLLDCVLNDDSQLVKRYAILSLIDIMNYIKIDKNNLKKLFLITSSSDNVPLMAACYKGLYLLGDEKYLDNIIELTTAESYRDRCAVVNILGDIVTNNNRQRILNVLKGLKETDDSEAVKSTIERVICEMNRG